MNIEVRPSAGELKVTLIENGVDVTHTKIEALASFELISRDSVLYIEPIKMGAEPKSDPQQLELPF